MTDYELLYIFSPGYTTTADSYTPNTRHEEHVVIDALNRNRPATRKAACESRPCHKLDVKTCVFLLSVLRASQTYLTF